MAIDIENETRIGRKPEVETRDLYAGTEIYSAPFGRDEAVLLGVVPEGEPWKGVYQKKGSFQHAPDGRHGSRFVQVACSDQEFNNRGVFLHYFKSPEDGEWHLIKQKPFRQTGFDPERVRRGIGLVHKALAEAVKKDQKQPSGLPRDWRERIIK